MISTKQEKSDGTNLKVSKAKLLKSERYKRWVKLMHEFKHI